MDETRRMKRRTREKQYIHGKQQNRGTELHHISHDNQTVGAMRITMGRRMRTTRRMTSARRMRRKMITGRTTTTGRRTRQRVRTMVDFGEDDGMTAATYQYMSQLKKR